MKEVTEEYIRAYFHDRFKELEQQEPHGNPVMFLAAFVYMRAMANLSKDRTIEDMIYVMGLTDNKGDVAVHVSRAISRMLDTFSLNPNNADVVVELSHEKEESFNPEGPIILNSKKLIERLHVAVDKIDFSPANLDRVRMVGLQKPRGEVNERNA